MSHQTSRRIGVAVCLVVACAGVAVRASQSAVETETTWAQVLSLAEGGGAGAKADLERIAAQSSASPPVLLAQEMLKAWVDERNTYANEKPRLLGSGAIPRDKLKRLGHVPMGGEPIVAELEVNVEGHVAGRNLLDSPRSSALRRLVVEHLDHLLFCPARVGGQYRSAKTTIVINIDVR